MMTSPTNENTVRELDRRVNEGIDVRLLWSSASDQVVVVVLDTRTDESFEIEVAPSDAMLAFQHPYAYANCPPTDPSLVV